MPGFTRRGGAPDTPPPPPPAPGTEVAVTDQASGEIVQLNTETLARVQAAVEQIPDGGTGDASGLIEQIIAADKVTDLDRPWRTNSGRDLAGRPLTVTGMVRRPSDFDGPVPVYLQVQAVDRETGEQVTFSTSSLAVIVQLAMARANGWLPLQCTITMADKPTRRGFRPYHLDISAVRAGQ